jgi:atypical dual specificity phosphatase
MEETKNYIIENTNYQISLMYNVMSNWYKPDTYNWWTQMSDQIYLGALPLKHRNLLSYYYSDENQCNILKQLGITDVISINKNFELSAYTLFSKPVSENEWKELGITQYIFEADDFKPIDIRTIHTCVELIERLLEDETKKIYLHCKAGKGRSVTMYVCYLIKSNPNKSVDEIIQIVADKRSQINLNEDQKENIHTYYKYYSLL